MNKSIKVAEIDGIWHKLVMNKTGYYQWIPCTASHGDIAHKAEDDADLRFVHHTQSRAVDKILNAIDGIVPDDFIAYLRREAEAIVGHRLAESGMLEANGNVVKVSVHISLSLENVRVVALAKGSPNITATLSPVATHGLIVKRNLEREWLQRLREDSAEPKHVTNGRNSTQTQQNPST